MSLLAVPGILLKRKGHSWLGLVLSSSHFGISRIRRPLNKIGTTWMLDSSLGAGSIVFDIITEHKDWNGMQIDTYTPTDPSSRAGTVRLCPRGDHKTNVGVQRQTGPHNVFCCLSSQVVRGAECAVHKRRETKDGGGVARWHFQVGVASFLAEGAHGSARARSRRKF